MQPESIETHEHITIKKNKDSRTSQISNSCFSRPFTCGLGGRGKTEQSSPRRLFEEDANGIHRNPRDSNDHGHNSRDSQ